MENKTERLCLAREIDNSKSNPQRFKKLLKEPKYMCRECGRVAANDYNLCYPKPL